MLTARHIAAAALGLFVGTVSANAQADATLTKIKERGSLTPS